MEFQLYWTEPVQHEAFVVSAELGRSSRRVGVNSVGLNFNQMPIIRPSRARPHRVAAIYSAVAGIPRKHFPRSIHVTFSPTRRTRAASSRRGCYEDVVRVGRVS